MSEEKALETFGNRLRVRVCGILIEADQVLMVKHRSITKEGVFWSPPGGGLEYGERTEAALKREFLEETGLQIEIERFLCSHEFLAPPLHGIELFFLVRKTGGTLITGKDPEMQQHQIIESVEFLTFETIKSMKPALVHNLFKYCQTIKEVEALTGLYPFFGEK